MKITVFVCFLSNLFFLTTILGIDNYYLIQKGNLNSGKKALREDNFFNNNNLQTSLAIHPSSTDKAEVPAETIPNKSVSTANKLSIFPGGGEFYLGNYQKGFLYLFPWAVYIISLFDGNKLSQALLGQFCFDLYLYSIFDTYRDARLLIKNLGFKKPVTDKSLLELLKSPYKPENLFNSYSLLVLAEGALTMTSFYLLTNYKTSNNYSSSISGSGTRYSLSMPSTILLSLLFGTIAYLVYTPVAVAEEAFFRGYLQADYNERYEDLTSLLLASAVFGIVHIPQVIYEDAALKSSGGLLSQLRYLIPFRFFTAFSGGLVFGWIFNRENCDLEKSITAHTLGNTIITMAAPIMMLKGWPYYVSFSYRF